MTRNKIAYLAGLIDGEGNIAVIRRELSRRENYNVRVSLYNNSIPLITWILKEFGGTKTTRSRRNPRHATSYIISWNHAQAAKLLRAVKPFLIVKAKQAKLALQAATIRSGNKPGRSGTPEVVLENLRLIKKRIAVLNRKGPQEKK